MGFYYTHRSVPHSAIIREASFSNKQNKNTETHRRYAENMRLETLGPKPVKSLPLCLSEACERGGRKSVRVRGDEGHQIKKVL